eukprot:scaffold47878_cov16-Tisochrysis_lutea.AAC.1
MLGAFFLPSTASKIRANADTVEAAIVRDSKESSTLARSSFSKVEAGLDKIAKQIVQCSAQYEAVSAGNIAFGYVPEAAATHARLPVLHTCRTCMLYGRLTTISLSSSALASRRSRVLDLATLNLSWVATDKKRAATKRKLTALTNDSQKQVAETEERLSKIRSKSTKLPGKFDNTVANLNP